MASVTEICPKCNGEKIITRYVSTTLIDGYVELRYTPIEPQLCWFCIDTTGDDNAWGLLSDREND